jgi:iron(III) transport system permease protein
MRRRDRPRRAAGTISFAAVTEAMTETTTHSAPSLSLAGREWILRRWPHPLAGLFLLTVAALVLAPLINLALIASTGDADLWPHLVAHVIPGATINTVLLLAGVAAVTVTFGTATAWIVTAYDFPGRNAFTWLLPLPLAFPTYIVAYVYADLFGGVGPVQSALRFVFGWSSAAEYWFPDVRSLGGAILVMGFVLYPYVYLAARAMFQTQSMALIEAARGFGATQWRLVRDIALPMARPAIAAGTALALLETLNDIGATEYFGVQTLTLSIFNTWLNRSSLPGAAQIACLMLVVIAALIALERRGRRRRDFGGLDARTSHAQRVMLAGAPRLLAALICLVPVGLGFVVPLVYLSFEVVERGLLIGFDPSLWRHTLTTVTIAVAATALVLALGFGAALALRIVRRPLASMGVFVASLGYAVPGTVLALALLSPLVAVDNIINEAARLMGLTAPGLILAGSGAALVCAYTVRFLAIAIGLAQAGLARIPGDLDDAARAAGAHPADLVRSIHLPLLRPALWGATLLVFVDCLKELPATLLLRPLNTETLSTYIYQFATRGSFEEGSLAALIIVLVGIVPVIRMVRAADTVLPGLVTRAEMTRRSRAASPEGA